MKKLCTRRLNASGAAQRFKDIPRRNFSMKRTKIVCTMGPSTDSKEILGALVDAGMDVARFNFSHGSYEEHKGRMDLLKEVRAEKKKPIAIMLDTKGPEIRTKLLKGGKKVELVEGQSFTLTTRDVEGTSEIVSQTYDRLPTDLKPGDTVLIDDGLIAMTVQETTDTDVVCRVDNGGMLGERKGINSRMLRFTPGHHGEGQAGHPLRDRAGDRLHCSFICQKCGEYPGDPGSAQTASRGGCSYHREGGEPGGDPEHRRDHPGSRRCDGCTR